MTSEYCMIEVAFGKKYELETSVKELLDKKLVSSCQVVESLSTWNWQGEREAEKEYLVFLKTKKSLLEEIYETIRKIHSYDCFEFAIFDMTSTISDYLNWIEKETK